MLRMRCEAAARRRAARAQAIDHGVRAAPYDDADGGPRG